MLGDSILCVDDEEAVRRLLVRLLTGRGYRAIAAASVAEARVELARTPFALVMCDITMPGETGLDLAEELARSASDTAVLMVTAHDDPALAARALDLGVYGYVLKPFEPTELLVTIDSALRRRAAELENRTHRRRLEHELDRSREDLRESDARFRRLADQASDVVFRFGLVPYPGFEYVSPSVERMIGYSPAELHADPSILQHIVHPDDLAGLEALGSEAAPSTLTLRWLARDGGAVWAEQSNVPVRTEDGTIVAIEGIARDVSDRNRAEEALRDSEQRFRSLIGNFPGALFSRALDADWTVHYVTDAIWDISGYPASDFIESSGRTYLSIVVEEDREQIEAAVREAVAASVPFSLAYRIVHADGSERWVGEKGKAVLDEDGSVLSLDGTISDITQRKLLELDRGRMEIGLRVAQKLEAVGQLAAGIAHEINTPVQFVGHSVQFLSGSFADLMQLVADYRALCLEVAGGADPAGVIARLEQADETADLAYLQERVPAALARSVAGIDRVSVIVKAMKDFGHSNQTEKAHADLNEALRTTLIVAGHAHKYVATLETDFGPLPPVLCNVSDLNQVFLNLIVNAAHAIEDGAGGGEMGTIRIETALDGDVAVIRISDSGCGIPPEIRTRIFDPFFTTKDVGRGTGQGLAIARSIVVDKHGGTLACESEVGHGTTFVIRLAVDGDAAEAGLAAA
jgi:two-component system NtrC family sensor kinase